MPTLATPTSFKHSREFPKDRKLAFHVTERRHVQAILERGLLPKVPEDMEDTQGVYLFPDYESMYTALQNWLGERMEKIEEETGRTYEEVLLVIDISGLTLHSDVGFELCSVITIPPTRILGEITQSSSFA
jgi:hypothetical protein